jgi:pectate lyase
VTTRMKRFLSGRTLSAAVAVMATAWLPLQALADASTDVAPATGWASRNGGTKGGAAATSRYMYKVSSASQLLAALKDGGTNPKIVKIYGTVDMAAADNGGPFTSVADQTARNKITIPANTTLIGMGSTATITNAAMFIKRVDNVIIRNLTIVAPCDIEPMWDPNDNGGRWNSRYDALVIDGATHVWIDHNVFTDAPTTDDQAPVVNGQRKQCHDGALDIQHAADFITVSYNVFDQHDKNTLVGSSDSDTADEGHLTVTFNHNAFKNVMERAPRVRFGKVHVYNNYYQGDKANTAYPHNYSIGVGYKAKIVSAANVLDIAGASSCPKVVKNPGTSTKTGAIVDTGSLLNGAALNLSTSCSFSNAVGWTVPYAATPLPAGMVKSTVTSQAGVGKLTVN